jgi:diadenosine tetraphosphate (Ap4A) HIT family hydrolase
MSIVEQVKAAHTGTDPSIICQVPSGWVALAHMQLLRGYCILMHDPVVPALNSLEHDRRIKFLDDMASVGDALLEVTGAFRINYVIMGNSDPVLHAHIVPRYINEPEEQRHGGFWSYPQELMDGAQFDIERDRELIRLLVQAIEKRIS